MRFLDQSAAFLRSLDEAVDIIHQFAPRHAYLTHLSHDFDHDTVNAKLPPDIRLAILFRRSLRIGKRAKLSDRSASKLLPLCPIWAATRFSSTVRRWKIRRPSGQ